MSKPMPKNGAAEGVEPKLTVSAAEMGARQREISVSEFFTKNRHLLGFDNPRKALLTCVKEAVDNALDACEEAGLLPEVVVKLDVATNGDAALPPSQANRFRVTVIDYGPGIVRQQIPRIFAKLLYGSKFHRLRMSRGQQGIGISAAGISSRSHDSLRSISALRSSKNPLRAGASFSAVSKSFDACSRLCAHRCNSPRFR